MVKWGFKGLGVQLNGTATTEQKALTSTSVSRCQPVVEDRGEAISLVTEFKVTPKAQLRDNDKQVLSVHP